MLLATKPVLASMRITTSKVVRVDRIVIHAVIPEMASIIIDAVVLVVDVVAEVVIIVTVKT